MSAGFAPARHGHLSIASAGQEQADGAGPTEHIRRPVNAGRRLLVASRSSRADDLHARNIGALLPGVDPYPRRLAQSTDTPPVLFYSGPLDLLQRPCVGICGSRNASADGLRAAAACGELAAQQGAVTVSGYARGVDRATHVATLEHGGATIVVLPEGIDHFKVRRGEVAAAWDPDRVLVLSQFAPTQTWSTGAAHGPQQRHHRTEQRARRRRGR